MPTTTPYTGPKLLMNSPKFTLWKEQWDNYQALVDYAWKVVKFESSNTRQIPNSPGIYAFFIEPKIAQFPQHGYLMYIGKAGDNSSNTLRKRYRNYLYEKKSVDIGRSGINFMLNQWDGYVYFYYCVIEDQSIQQHEERLLDTFIPPFVQRGFSAHVSEVVNAFRGAF